MQLKSVWAIAQHDLLMWRKMPMAIACAVTPPAAMGLLIVVLTLTVTRQPVALVVQAHGDNADRMANLVRSDTDAYALTETTVTHAAEMLKCQQVAAIITIPIGFNDAVNAHRGQIELKLNNIDVDFSDDIRRSVERSAGQFDGLETGQDAERSVSKDAATAGADWARPITSKAAVDKADSGGTSDNDGEGAERTAQIGSYPDLARINAYHIGILEHDLRETSVDFLHYQVLPVLVLLVLSVGVTGTAIHCAMDGERGTSRLLVLAPVSTVGLVAGRLLGGLISCLALLAPVVAACIAFRTISATGMHLVALSALLVMTALCAAGLGALLGSFVRGAANVAMAASVLATYLFFMGGGFTTIAFLPSWLRVVSAFDPMRYAIDGMRQALFYPDLKGFGTSVTVLGGTAVASMLFGSLAVLRSWRIQAAGGG